jgi:hypothetical protein
MTAQSCLTLDSSGDCQMRTMLLTSVAAFGLALAAPALAQNAGTAPGTPPTVTNGAIPPPHQLMRAGSMDPSTGARWGHTPGIGESLPMSPHASNIAPQDTRSVIAPSLPVPIIGENATPAQFLGTARDALARGRTGEAQEALERAETRRLDRDTMRGISPENDPMIGKIRAALDSLSSRNVQMAQQNIADALPAAAENGGTAMENGGTGMESGAAMNMTNPSGGSVSPYPDTGAYQAERHHTAMPGTQGVEVSPPGTQMNPNGTQQ